jgi:hypothetical protein
VVDGIKVCLGLSLYEKMKKSQTMNDKKERKGRKGPKQKGKNCTYILSVPSVPFFVSFSLLVTIS